MAKDLERLKKQLERGRIIGCARLSVAGASVMTGASILAKQAMLYAGIALLSSYVIIFCMNYFFGWNHLLKKAKRNDLDIEALNIKPEEKRDWWHAVGGLILVALPALLFGAYEHYSIKKLETSHVVMSHGDSTLTIPGSYLIAHRKNDLYKVENGGGSWIASANLRTLVAEQDIDRDNPISPDILYIEHLSKKGKLYRDNKHLFDKIDVNIAYKKAKTDDHTPLERISLEYVSIDRSAGKKFIQVFSYHCGKPRELGHTNVLVRRDRQGYIGERCAVLAYLKPYGYFNITYSCNGSNLEKAVGWNVAYNQAIELIGQFALR